MDFNFFEIEDNYFKKFRDYFPSMSFQNKTQVELVEMMNKCIEKNIPAEKLFNISNSDNIQY